jgi:hypothetical protein
MSKDEIQCGGFKLRKVCVGRWTVRRGHWAVGAVMKYGDRDYQVLDRCNNVLADHVVTLKRAVKVFEK